MNPQESTAKELLYSIDVSDKCNKLWLYGVEFTRNNSGLFEVTDQVELNR